MFVSTVGGSIHKCVCVYMSNVYICMYKSTYNGITGTTLLHVRRILPMSLSERTGFVYRMRVKNHVATL
jgi:hypothetical protein